jgi:hypothetical protein
LLDLVGVVGDGGTVLVAAGEAVFGVGPAPVLGRVDLLVVEEPHGHLAEVFH